MTVYHQQPSISAPFTVADRIWSTSYDPLIRPVYGRDFCIRLFWEVPGIMLIKPLTEQVVNVGYMRHLERLAAGLFRVPGNKCGQTLNRPEIRQGC